MASASSAPASRNRRLDGFEPHPRQPVDERAKTLRHGERHDGGQKLGLVIETQDDPLQLPPGASPA